MNNSTFPRMPVAERLTGTMSRTAAELLCKALGAQNQEQTQANDNNSVNPDMTAPQSQSYPADYSANVARLLTRVIISKGLHKSLQP